MDSQILLMVFVRSSYQSQNQLRAIKISWKNMCANFHGSTIMDIMEIFGNYYGNIEQVAWEFPEYELLNFCRYTGDYYGHEILRKYQKVPLVWKLLRKYSGCTLKVLEIN